MIRSALRIDRKLKKGGRTWDELREWHDNKPKPKSIRVKRCPKDKGVMKLQPVDEESCMWQCRKCMFGIPVYHSFKKEMKLWQSEM